MRVSIYSLKKNLYEGTGASVNCKTISGEITVLEHHRPLITILDKGTVTVTDVDGRGHYFPISSGFLEVQPPPSNGVRLIVEE